MLFRIENVNDVDANLRTYCPEDFLCVSVDKAVIDEFIASMIRQEINGAKNRSIWSYSKSLAACILKYNKNADNELHIFDEGINLDSILYVDSDGKLQRDFYSLRERLYWGHKRPFFADGGKITLRNFVIDVSDNDLVDEYLRLYTGKGRKKIASPEKDSEVAVMNPSNDLTIIQYLSTVYTLYALQYRYRFLCCDNARINLIRKIQRLDDFRFFGCEDDERFGLMRLVNYLADDWQYEYRISRGIYEYFKQSENFSFYYDSLHEFDAIISENFDEAYHNSDYNDNIISELCWRVCYRTISGQYAYDYYDPDEDGDLL